MPNPIKLSDAIDGYLAHLQARGLATGSIKNNRQVVHRLLVELGNIQVQSIQPRHVDRFFAAGKWGPSTQNLYLGYVRQFFAWCRAHGFMHRDTDPTVGWRNIRVPKTERTRVPLHDFPLLLDAANHPRDRAVVALGLFTFMRGSEVQALRVGDLDLAGCTLHMYRDKTEEEDTLPVSEELRVEMVRWLNWYRQDQGYLDPHWFLVPAKEKDEWGSDGAGGFTKISGVASVKPTQRMTHPYRAVQRTLTLYGIEEKGTGGHTLRRSGARALFDTLREQGYDGALMRVSSMLGHHDTRVTEKYIGLGLERMQRNEQFAGKRMFPTLTETGKLRVVNDG